MLLAHFTKSIRGHFLVHICSLSSSFEHVFGPQNRPQPEKVDCKKYDKIELKNDPKKALKWPPTPDPRTVFLMYCSLLYPSWGPCRSKGRHKGAEATKMMPELPQRVHKLVLKSHTNAVNHCQSLGKMPTKSIHTSTHSRCSTSACTYIYICGGYLWGPWPTFQAPWAMGPTCYPPACTLGVHGVPLVKPLDCR